MAQVSVQSMPPLEQARMFALFDQLKDVAGMAERRRSSHLLMAMPARPAASSTGRY